MITIAKPCVISFYFSVKTCGRIFLVVNLFSLLWISMAEAAVRASREEQPSSPVSPSNRSEPVTEKCKRTIVRDLEFRMSATDAKFEAIIKMLQDRDGVRQRKLLTTTRLGLVSLPPKLMTMTNDMSSLDIDRFSILPSMSEVRDLFSDSDSSSDLSSVSFSKRKKVKHDLKFLHR